MSEEDRLADWADRLQNATGSFEAALKSFRGPATSLGATTESHVEDVRSQMQRVLDETPVRDDGRAFTDEEKRAAWAAMCAAGPPPF